MNTSAIYKAIWQVRFPPSAFLLDRRGEIAAEWHHKYGLTEWKIDLNRVEIFNKTGSAALVADISSVAAVMELPEDYENFAKLAADFTTKTLDALHVRRIERAGLRFHYAIPHDNFKLLVTRMRRNLYNFSEEDWNIFGALPEDIAISLVFDLGEDKANFQAGPMQQEQLATNFRSEEVKQKLPQTSVFIDIDLYREEPKWSQKEYSKNIRGFLESGRQKIEQMSNSFLQKFGEFK